MVEARKKNYLIEGFLTNYEINPDHVKSDFDTGRNVLTVNLPVVECN